MDITKCDGDGCKIRAYCIRYTAPANPTGQSWAPLHETRKPCVYFWKDAARLDAERGIDGNRQ